MSKDYNQYFLSILRDSGVHNPIEFLISCKAARELKEVLPRFIEEANELQRVLKKTKACDSDDDEEYEVTSFSSIIDELATSSKKKYSLEIKYNGYHHSYALTLSSDSFDNEEIDSRHWEMTFSRAEAKQLLNRLSYNIEKAEDLQLKKDIVCVDDSEASPPIKKLLTSTPKSTTKTRTTISISNAI